MWPFIIKTPLQENAVLNPATQRCCCCWKCGTLKTGTYPYEAHIKLATTGFDAAEEQWVIVVPLCTCCVEGAEPHMLTGFPI